MAKKYMKRVLNMTNHQGNTNKTTMRDHLIFVMKAIIKTNIIYVNLWRN